MKKIRIITVLFASLCLGMAGITHVQAQEAPNNISQYASPQSDSAFKEAIPNLLSIVLDPASSESVQQEAFDGILQIDKKYGDRKISLSPYAQFPTIHAQYQYALYHITRSEDVNDETYELAFDLFEKEVLKTYTSGSDGPDSALNYASGLMTVWNPSERISNAQLKMIGKIQDIVGDTVLTGNNGRALARFAEKVISSNMLSIEVKEVMFSMVAYQGSRSWGGGLMRGSMLGMLEGVGTSFDTDPDVRAMVKETLLEMADYNTYRVFSYEMHGSKYKKIMRVYDKVVDFEKTLN